MKNITITALIGLSLLAACSMNGSNKMSAAVDKKACMTLHPSTQGNFVDQANCMTDNENGDSSAANADLTAQLQTSRLALAKSADAGVITPAAYQGQLHKLEAQIATQEQARKTGVTAN